MRAGRMVVNNYSTKAIDLLLPELEGMFDPGWRIRVSFICPPYSTFLIFSYSNHQLHLWESSFYSRSQGFHAKLLNSTKRIWLQRQLHLVVPFLKFSARNGVTEFWPLYTLFVKMA
jgi:hypothetical protein